MWLIRIDMLEIALMLGRRSGRRQTQADVVRWLASIGMKWLGDDTFVANDGSTTALHGGEIIESCSLTTRQNSA